MAAYENDSEAYRWDFGIFDPFPNPSYYGSGADQETTFYSNYCVREGMLIIHASVGMVLFCVPALRLIFSSS